MSGIDLHVCRRLGPPQNLLSRQLKPYTLRYFSYVFLSSTLVSQIFRYFLLSPCAFAYKIHTPTPPPPPPPLVRDKVNPTPSTYIAHITPDISDFHRYHPISDVGVGSLIRYWKILLSDFMEMKVAANCMHATSQALASSIPSPSSRRRPNVAVSHFVHRSAMFGKAASSTKLLRTGSCEVPKARRGGALRRAISEGSDGFSDEEFAESIRELALRFHLEGNENEEQSGDAQGESSSSSGYGFSSTIGARSKIDSTERRWLRIRPEPPYEMVPASIERKANSLDLPLSLRMLKKKNHWKEDFRDTGESAYCSVKKAFSSMVFIIRELHSYTLQMREFLFLEDVQGVLARVQQEMNASFVWLFQQIFSHTPTLMMYVMILMANFTVYSMSSNAAIAAPLPVDYCSTTEATEIVSSTERQQNPKLDSSQVKRFSDSAAISVGGNSGGGGTVKPIGSGTEGGDGRFSGVSSIHPNIVPDELSQLSSFSNPAAEQISIHEETKLWNSIVEEASEMQAAFMDEALDHETMNQFVSPIKAQIESDDLSEQSRTEQYYEQAISQDPGNPLLLSNYAQFLYLVVHDHDRAEEYFKRAKEAKPSDAEALNKYASFLWMVKKDLDAAEETFLEAIDAEPGNAYYAGNYAQFLWNTGGEDTCYPLT